MDPESLREGLLSINNAANQIINFDKLAEFTNNLEDALYKHLFASLLQNNRLLVNINNLSDIKFNGNIIYFTFLKKRKNFFQNFI